MEIPPFFPKFAFFFVTVITFSPFFCANNYYTSLLLIVCALRWYIKSPHRHIFLVDISKHARVTHSLIYGKDNSKAPWPPRPQIGLRVAKALSCDTDESEFFSGEPPLSYSVEKRRDHWNLPYAHAKLRGRTANFCDPASSQHYNSGGVHRKKILTRQYHS